MYILWSLEILVIVIVLLLLLYDIFYLWDVPIFVHIHGILLNKVDRNLCLGYGTWTKFVPFRSWLVGDPKTLSICVQGASEVDSSMSEPWIVCIVDLSLVVDLIDVNGYLCWLSWLVVLVDYLWFVVMSSSVC